MPGASGAVSSGGQDRVDVVRRHERAGDLIIDPREITIRELDLDPPRTRRGALVILGREDSVPAAA